MTKYLGGVSKILGLTSLDIQIFQGRDEDVAEGDDLTHRSAVWSGSGG